MANTSKPARSWASMLLGSLLTCAGCGGSASTLNSATPAFDANPRVLIVVSAAHTLALTNGVAHPTGHFLGELAEPVRLLLDHGFSIDFASPGGTAPAIDQDSLRDIYWLADRSGRTQDSSLVASLPGWKAPMVLEDLSEAQLNGYQGVFVPGGHAPMVDLYQNAAMGRVLTHFHNSKQPIGLICHAPIVLMATAGTAPWPFAGYNLTVFSKTEEKIAETFFLHGSVPFYPDDVLAAEGAVIHNGLLPSLPNVIVDRELVTGQNPYSPKPFAEAFVKELEARRVAPALLP